MNPQVVYNYHSVIAVPTGRKTPRDEKYEEYSTLSSNIYNSAHTSIYTKIRYRLYGVATSIHAGTLVPIDYVRITAFVPDSQRGSFCSKTMSLLYSNIMKLLSIYDIYNRSYLSLQDL